MLILKQENDQHALRAPSMTRTTGHRCTSENKNKHKDKNKNKTSSSLSPLYSQLIQKFCSLHCDSCLVTELDQGTTGALAVYGLPEGLLKNDSGRIRVKPDLNDEWVHHPVGTRGATAAEGERRQHEKATIQQNDYNDADYEMLHDWDSEIISKDNDGDRAKTDDTQPFVTVLNHNGVGCAYDDGDSIAGPIGDTSILQPDSDFAISNNVSSIGELEKCTTTPFFQDCSSSLLPPPTPRPRPMELTDTDFEDPSLSFPPPPPPPPSSSQDTMVLFSSDWEMEKTQHFNSLAYNQQTSDHDVVSVLFESTSSSPFLHTIPTVKDEIGIPDLIYTNSLNQDDRPEHCDLLGLDGPRPRTAHGRQEVHTSPECLADGLEKTHLQDELPPPPAPRLGVLSDDFGEEEGEESRAETNYDSDTVYLFDPFDFQQQDSSSNSSWSDDSEDNLLAAPLPVSSEEDENLPCYSKSYPSPPPSPPNPFFPPGLPLRPPKKTKSSSINTTQSPSYALSEKSQWKLSVMQFQRSLSTRGMRHPGFPPSPLGPNWEVYHRRRV